MRMPEAVPVALCIGMQTRTRVPATRMAHRARATSQMVRCTANVGVVNSFLLYRVILIT